MFFDFVETSMNFFSVLALAILFSYFVLEFLAKLFS